MDEKEFEMQMAFCMGLHDNKHFYEELYQKAVGGMENNDGTKGPHYSMDEVHEIIQENDIELGEYNELDFGYSLNMIYSDYYGILPDKKESYVEMAKAFLFDKDGPKGKAVKYYMAMAFGD